MKTMAGLPPCLCCAKGIGKTGLTNLSVHTSARLVHRSLLPGVVHHLHVSARHLHDSLPPPTRAVQFPHSPLKLASASGSTPPPDETEDPIDSIDSPPTHPALSAPATSPPTSGPRPLPPESFARAPRSRGRPRGSSSRRNKRTAQSRQTSIFKPRIPHWFIERNVTLVSPPLFNPAEVPNSAEQSPTDAHSAIYSRKIRLSPFIQKELEAHSAAALLVPTTQMQENSTSQKAHVHLRCPRRGAIYFLDGIVEDLAAELEADMVRLDGQDLDELLELLIDPVASNQGLGQIFFTNLVRDQAKEDQSEEVGMEEENEEIEEEESNEDPAQFRVSPDIPLRLFQLFAPRPIYPSSVPSTSSSFSSSDRHPPPGENKVTTFLDVLLSAPSEKRKGLQKKFQRHGDHAQILSLRPSHDRTVVHLRDLQSILDTPRGEIAHEALLQVIQNRRRLGERIMLIVSDDRGDDAGGTPSSASRYYHVVNVPPPTSPGEKAILQDDRAARTREINLRSIQSTIRQRCRSADIEFNCPAGIHLDASATLCIPRLDQAIWESGKVQRVASIVIGSHGRWKVKQKDAQTSPITIADIALAVEDMEKADQERADRKSDFKSSRDAVTSHQPEEEKRSVPPFNPINSKDCTKHEQKLLAGVIDPDKIQVGFSDIRAPESTVQTLKILVSLPLRRPDAFSYGVLAKNFINGVLLFGPPGTGKTMLAKAIAKESGARVLEIKGSEVYDMYVGEGEKNVKAIFSLARKLSPCVVFIDEVDTIFSSRNGSDRHVSHREIINQFMAEWDGINALNSGVLILGATNRPFDLDDAILRRMPRRILVDLPTEEDRLAILKLILSDELLDPSVDLPALAKRTNLYSGSDLKNACVSAALAAVTEEQASTHILAPIDPNARGKEDDLEPSKAELPTEVEPAKRILNADHFDKALTEVTASISESMETIELLRKFDREYGNAKEKKRKLMGFGTVAEEAVANVRIMHP